MKGYLKRYDQPNNRAYFDALIATDNNGNQTEAREMFDALPAKLKAEFVAHLDFEELPNFAFDFFRRYFQSKA